MNITVIISNYLQLTKITTNDLILIITGLILIYYAYCTRGLWKESVKQTFLQNSPIPALYLKERNGKDYLLLKNIGSKPLINIDIENWNITLFLKDRTERYRFEFSVPFPNIVVPEEEIDVQIKQSYNGKEENVSGISPFINPRYSPFITPVHVIFSDISGKKYYARFLFGGGKLKMLGAIKKYTIIKSIHMKIAEYWYIAKEPITRKILLKRQKNTKTL